MADILVTTSETLEFFESDNIFFVQNITTTINEGMYIKLSNKEYIFANYSQVSDSEAVVTPLYFGYKNDNTLINLEFSYNEV